MSNDLVLSFGKEAGVPPEVWSEFEASLNEDIEAWSGAMAAYIKEYEAEVDKAGHGVMIGYFLPEDLAKELACPDGEAPEELHFTIGYFGKGLDEDQVETLKEITANFAARLSPMSGNIDGVGRFAATESSDNKDVIIRLVNIARLEQLREEMLQALQEEGIEAYRNHGYTPHITLKYVDPQFEMTTMTIQSLPITLDKLTVAVGGEHFDFPMIGEEVLKINSCHNKRDGKFCSATSGAVSYKLNSRVSLSRQPGEPYVMRHSRNGNLATFHVTQDGKDLRFTYISSPGGPGSIGPKLMKLALGRIIADHPTATKVTGLRAFGRNRSGEETSIKVSALQRYVKNIGKSNSHHGVYDGEFCSGGEGSGGTVGYPLAGEEVLKRQSDAPHYRAAEKGVPTCFTCSHGGDGYCDAFHFNYLAGYTCANHTPFVKTYEKYVPPQEVQQNAQSGLRAWKIASGAQKGDEELMLLASALANGNPIDVEQLQTVNTYLKEHYEIASQAGWKEHGAEWQEWFGLGGRAGLSWSTRCLRNVEKTNSCHNPSGPSGGQFCSGSASSFATQRALYKYNEGESNAVTVAVNPPPPTDEEVNALEDYKGMGYASVNKFLLTKYSSITDEREFRNLEGLVTSISSVMGRASLEKETTLYRGIGGKPAAVISQLPVGSEFSVPCFQSTSASPKVAAAFSDQGRSSVIFQIKVPAGTPALPLDKLVRKLHATAEKEIVLDKDLRYRVTGKETKEFSSVGRPRTLPYTVVHLEVIK